MFRCCRSFFFFFLYSSYYNYLFFFFINITYYVVYLSLLYIVTKFTNLKIVLLLKIKHHISPNFKTYLTLSFELYNELGLVAPYFPKNKNKITKSNNANLFLPA